jgi:endonuclease/exonuclease/phosphatase family metal-dependent hydrolase
VRVLTQNLWGRFGAWADRRRVLLDALSNLRPGLVAFQEAIKTDEYDQAADLLGSAYHVAHQSERDADGSGCSIASRWPFLDVHEIDLDLSPRTASFKRVTLVAEIQTPETFEPLLFVNHKPNFQSGLEYERELQAVTVARFIEDLLASRRVHVVLAGDQDATPDAASIRFWCGLQSLSGISVCYRDAWNAKHPDDPGQTFMPGHNPLVNEANWPRDIGRRIDYVFVRCGDHGPTLEISACERFLDNPVGGVWASDHFGVVADLAVPASETMDVAAAVEQ